ncbi:hypothetical protein AMAG_13744 [Allomyces macrogynus ATCC 38327]|uniref:Uncharacterized protein n=1 Tax=Allomyces macrogynus (strain ATCC 38327) TaxID=578462 RepID=A0A0L0T3G2_ALLM3|nr:hypothetical protein AMAG_13744 [Allomyces macrogynus ATCC 38327]|eukprot:KNE69378.1 hypothetical protein AMAG_13744 [Allomyces macrogynus ATCC 38327]
MPPTTSPAAAAATARIAAAATSRRVAARHLTTTRIAQAAIKRPVSKPGAANPTPAPAASPIFPAVPTTADATDVLDASPAAVAEPGTANISADALFPSASLLSDWRVPTRRARLMIADAGITKILDTVDAILGDRTAQEMIKDQNVDTLAAQVRAAEPDCRQWSLLAEVLLAQSPCT